MSSEGLAQLFESSSSVSKLPLRSLLPLLGHAVGVGALLMVFTWNASRKTNASEQTSADLISASSSVLFLCIGMAAVMILVSDNLARAFAIGAAIALVRFRVKMEGKLLGMALLYGVLTGMACGVGRADLAWILAGIFVLVLQGVLLLRRLVGAPP